MAPMRKSAALKLIADFEHAVRDLDALNRVVAGPTATNRIQGQYDFEHTRILTRLTKE